MRFVDVISTVASTPRSPSRDQQNRGRSGDGIFEPRLGLSAVFNPKIKYTPTALREAEADAGLYNQPKTMRREIHSTRLAAPMDHQRRPILVTA